jgi:hypothetical protein
MGWVVAMGKDGLSGHHDIPALADFQEIVENSFKISKIMNWRP